MDRLNDTFRHILNLAEQYLQAAISLNDSAAPIFTLESGILSCLHIIAMKCREYCIRRKAIELFANSPRQEGLWAGGLFSRFAREVVDLEESGARSRQPDTTVVSGIKAADIREEERFSDVVFAATEDPKVGRLVCARFLHESTVELFIMEHLFEI